MSYFLLDIKKLYKSRIIIILLSLLFVVMIVDPISVYLQYGKNENFIKNIGQNGYMFWLLMNSRNWGFTVYHSLFLLWPVLSTALVFYNERNSSVCEFLIIRKSKKKYYLSKVFSVFIVTFINFIVLFSINELVTFLLFPLDAVHTEAYMNYIPSKDMFCYLLYQSSPLNIVFLYTFLNALTMALFSLFALAIHMIVPLKNKHLAVLVPFISLYVINYGISLALKAVELENYNLKLIIQPMVATLKDMQISIINVVAVFVSVVLVDIVALIIGYIRNRELI